MKVIASRDNPAYKAIAKLGASSKERKASGLALLDGAHLLAACLDAGLRPEAVVVSSDALDKTEVAWLVERSAPARVTVLSEALFRSLSSVQTPTGILATMRTPAARPVPPDASLVLVLEDIQDPGNVGTLLRSAAAAGAGHAVLCGQCAFAWSPKVLRAGVGAHFVLNVVEGSDPVEFVGRYRGQSVALSARGEQSIYDLDLHRATAFLVGNEGAGLSGPLLAAAKVRAHIPMPGGIESLNAATAGSICLFEAVRQRTLGPGPSSPERRPGRRT